MFRLYLPVLLLQAFCLYHAYKNNSAQKWYLLIILFPVIGSIIYLFENFYSRDNLKNIAEGVKHVVGNNYRVEQLEKELRFSDNIANKTNLADEYVTCGRYKEAITLYADCLKGFMAGDPLLQMKLLSAHFLNEDYESVIQCGNKLESEKSFKNAEERIAYAWALHFQGKTDLAVVFFKDMDKSFTNYKHRMEYCKFLQATGRSEDSKNKLKELLEEFEHMKSLERRLKKDIIREVKELYASLAKA